MCSCVLWSSPLGVDDSSCPRSEVRLFLAYVVGLSEGDGMTCDSQMPPKGRSYEGSDSPIPAAIIGAAPPRGPL